MNAYINVKAIVLIILIPGTEVLTAQVANPFIFSLETLDYNMKSHVKKIEVIPYDQIKGNPYFKTEFEECLVYFSDKKVAKAKARYDIYADDMQFSDGNKLYSIEKENVDSLVFKEEKFVFQKCMLDNRLKTCYFIILCNGKYQLLLKKNIRFLQKEPPKPYVTAEPDRFENLVDSYFIKCCDKPAILITNQKSLDKAFPEIAGKENNLIKSEKIRFSNPSDLIRLMQFLNSLN